MGSVAWQLPKGVKRQHSCRAGQLLGFLSLQLASPLTCHKLFWFSKSILLKLLNFSWQLQRSKHMLWTPPHTLLFLPFLWGKRVVATHAENPHSLESRTHRFVQGNWGKNAPLLSFLVCCCYLTTDWAVSWLFTGAVISQRPWGQLC